MAVKPVGTVGGVVLAALKATMCMTQKLVFWVAVALFEPVAVTDLSSVRAIILFVKLDLSVKPEPAVAVRLADAAPAP